MYDTHDRINYIVAEQFNVDESDVTRDASFVDDLHGDSLAMVELVMSVEEEFHLQIPDEQAEQLTTVSELEWYVEAHLR